MASDEELRGRLAEALERLDADLGAGIPAEECAAALLPEVKRYAAEKAAEALREALDHLGPPQPLIGRYAENWLRARADALAPEDAEVRRG